MSKTIVPGTKGTDETDVPSGEQSQAAGVDDVLERETADDEDEEEQTNESPEEHFKRLAGQRVAKVLERLDILELCAGRGYKYTDEQVDQMMKALRDRLDKLEHRFKKPQPFFSFD